MAVRRDDRRRLRRIEEGLASTDPDYARRLRRCADRLAEHSAPSAAEPVPRAALPLLWGAVLVAALVLVLATALAA
ncbi:hypothetical protein HNR12_000359 [Streptomonospora nanhaiensis]|uniref:DUF3040 domain-containing protein n=1 Tax=Streptomonospora nanhaiensis TaxID=1323731 RepID=A0A853BHK5_9ACTN|nr:DUF3040 domain-containing protein [Streptomonospora nanhaiensis]NYI94082.1 hypothetical protein [Streptomonospora nanhaiensis]